MRLVGVGQDGLRGQDQFEGGKGDGKIVVEMGVGVSG